MSPRRRLLILSGPTREYLDPVRYLSNASSGKQGIALAAEALARGHEVDLVQGPVHVSPPPECRTFSVVSTQEMLERARELHPACDALIGAAAVCDYRPDTSLDHKRKRHEGGWTLRLLPNPDILRELGGQKGKRIHIGFALETDKLIENSLRKLEEKALDWIVANHPDAIEAEESSYTLLGADGSRRDLGRISKQALAGELLDLVESR